MSSVEIQRSASTLDPQAKGVVGLLVLAGLAAVAYLPTTRWVTELWGSGVGNYSHGYIVLGAFFYLVWGNRHDIDFGRPKLFPLMLCGLLALQVLWLFAWLSQIASLQAMLMFAIYATAVACVVRNWWTMIMPLVLLSMAFPFWEVLIPVLQAMASFGVGSILRVVGITAFIDGNVINLPDGALVIASGCAGLAFLLTSLTLCLMSVLLNKNSVTEAVKILVIGGALAVVVNWIRISIIVYIGSRNGVDHPFVSDHIWLGWAIFAVLVLPYIFHVSNKFSEPVAEAGREPTGRLQVRAFILPIVPIALGFAGWSYFSSQAADIVDPRIVSASDTVSQATTTGAGPLLYPSFDGGMVSRAVITSRNGIDIEVFAATYGREQQDQELVSSLNYVVRKGLVTSEEKVALKDGPAVVMTTQGAKPSAILYRYQVGDDFYVGTLRTKLAQAMAKVRADHRASVIVLGAKCATDCAAEVQTLSEVAASTRVDVELVRRT